MINGLKLDPKYIEEENIIAKLQLVMQLERRSPYAKGTIFEPLSERMEKSLRAIPSEYHQYVLALFANTIYCTEQFSTSIMLHLFNTLINRLNLTQTNFGDNCLVIEVDPTGMINDFLRLNKVQGRLDKNTFQRAQQLEDFIDKANLEKALNNFISDKDENIKNDINEIIKKSHISSFNRWINMPNWIVLTDNALSGTSLKSALSRLITFANECNVKPNIFVLIRTLTSKADNLIKRSFKDLIKKNSLSVYSGLFLPEDYCINKNNLTCKLFKTNETLPAIKEACAWLVKQQFYKTDSLIADHKKNSKGDVQMQYGFKGCGLTFVSCENCPSDSLPLLWYNNENNYMGPFPRVLSRIRGAK